MAKREKQGDSSVAVGYVRRSKDKQALTPAAQRAAITAYCAQHGLRLAAVFVDSLTGATPLDQRAAFTAAMGAVREFGAGVVIVAKRDRIARDVVVAALAERAVNAAGARLVSADGAANGDSPADGFMRDVLNAASAYERMQIKTRTKAALDEKRKRGERTGGLPYGFKEEAGKLVPDAAEQAVIERVRALRADGVSFARITRQLAAEGIKPRSGGTWFEMQLQRMMARYAA